MFYYRKWIKPISKIVIQSDTMLLIDKNTLKINSSSFCWGLPRPHSRNPGGSQTSPWKTTVGVNLPSWNDLNIIQENINLAIPLSLTFELLSWHDLDSKAKVCKLDVHVVVQEDVLRLQVPVDNVLAVEKLDHLQQSTHDLPKTNIQTILNFRCMKTLMKMHCFCQIMNKHSLWPRFLLTQSNLLCEVVKKFPPLHPGGKKI